MRRGVQVPVAFLYAPWWWRRATPERRARAMQLAKREYPEAAIYNLPSCLFAITLTSEAEAADRAVQLPGFLAAAIDYGLCQYDDGMTVLDASP